MAKNKAKVIIPFGCWLSASYDNASVDTDPITITSVAYKDIAKVPPVKSYLWDIRKCVINPYAVPGLRKLTGLDEPVRKFLLGCPNTKKVVEYILFYSPIKHHYCKNIIIACTGGKHRSPAIAEMVAEKMKIKHPDTPVVVKHWSLK